ncbi:MAG: DUF1836 domain-containing protein [Clostridiales bacterium]|nr:DUF1836 domain-containing protein [Clostridiales bacterium]
MDIRCLPGTTIEAVFDGPDAAGRILGPIFLTEGLVLSQVVSLTGLSAHVLQNWVKRGFVEHPVGKKYSRAQFCRIAMFNFLKDSLQLDCVARLLAHAEWDNLMDSYGLYCAFVDAIAIGKGSRDPEIAAQAALANYQEPYPGARQRVATVLKVMLILYAATRLRKQADVLLGEIG